MKGQRSYRDTGQDISLSPLCKKPALNAPSTLPPVAQPVPGPTCSTPDRCHILGSRRGVAAAPPWRPATPQPRPGASPPGRVPARPALQPTQLMARPGISGRWRGDGGHGVHGWDRRRIFHRASFVIFRRFGGDTLWCPIETAAYDLEWPVGDLATQLFGSDGMSNG